MNYNTGSTVKVRLYSGQIVTANIIDIVSRSAGRKIHIAYENSTTVVNPAQIIEVTEAPPVAETRVPSSVSAAPNSAFAGAAASKSAAVAAPVPNSAGVAARIPGSAAVAAAPAAVRKRPTSQVVREIAEDYLQLARSNGATPDALRESNYRWLIKLADKIRAKSPLRPL